MISRAALHSAQNYAVELPQALNELTSGKVDVGSPDLDLETAQRNFVEHEFDVAAYQCGLERLRRSVPRIGESWLYLAPLARAWRFRILPRYTVRQTLYGMGGSYDVRSGSVVIKTTPMGLFKRPDPSHTVLHEIVHIGIDEPIVDRFSLTHPEKERVVDLICSIALGPLLRSYVLSSRGDHRMDAFVVDRDLTELPTLIRQYIDAFPRAGAIQQENAA